MNGVTHFNNSTAQFFNDSLAQFFQQRFGLLQILRVKPFGKPVVDLCQRLLRCRRFTLLLPQVCEARRCPHFHESVERLTPTGVAQDNRYIRPSLKSICSRRPGKALTPSTA